MARQKLSPRRLSDFHGPRRKKPPVRLEAAELRDAIGFEHETLQSLIRDAMLRRAILKGEGRPIEPLVVWTDFDHTYRHTEINPRQLTKWKKLTEYMKLQLGFLVALEFGGYSFTCNVPDVLVQKWNHIGAEVPAMVQKRCRRALEKHGLADLLYAYILEGRSKSAKSRTQIHLHGYFVAEDPMIATKFKLAIEEALLHERRNRLLSSTAFDIQRAYDIDRDDGRGYGRWVGYSVKNASKWDARIKGRRVFISRPMVQTARSFWELLHTDPIKP